MQLVIGSLGLIGNYLYIELKGMGLEVVGTCFSHKQGGLVPLDIRQSDQVSEIITRYKPEIIYLPAALPNVDFCEQNPAQSYATNVAGTHNVIQTANTVGAKVVFFSTDYLFDGRDGPYREDGHPNPICEYGRQKLIAEHMLLLQCNHFMIIRTHGVFGVEHQGKNFVYRVITTLRENKILKVPIDQVGTPTGALSLIRSTIELSRLIDRGVINVSGTESINRYEFACEIAKTFGLDPSLIRPVNTCDLGQIAPRPLKTGLVVEKANAILSRPLVSYHEGLQTMYTELLSNK